jgi:hypothetical protein
VRHLDFFLCIKATGSRSSLEKPESDSRHLYAGHHPPNNQVAGGFILGELPAPSFDVLVTVSTRIQWFSFIRLSDSYLSVLARLFLNAHDRCSLQQPLEVV